MFKREVRKSSTLLRLPSWLGCLWVAGLMLAPVRVALAEEGVIDVPPSTTPASTTAPSHMTLPAISVAVGRTTLVETPWPIRRVKISDPKVADIQVFTATEILVAGKGVGATDLLLWGDQEQSAETSVSVHMDRSSITEGLVALLPDSKLTIHLTDKVVVVGGTLHRADEAQALHRFLEALKTPYVDMTTVGGPQQVEIKVTLAEANRVAIRALGVQINSNGDTAIGFANAVPDGGTPLATFDQTTGLLASVAPAVSLIGSLNRANVQAFVAALSENQYLRILAQPDMVAVSGEDATFLVGGEFPIPLETTTGSNSGITIDYKKFGVQLDFRPTVLGDGRIRMYVAPTSSALSTGTGAIDLNGFNIPGIVERSASTTLEMNNGETLAMGGLIDHETQARSSKIPALGDIPILGSLFRSVRYQQNDTELVMLVTASLVEPTATASDMAVPGMMHQVPNDWELYADGKVEGESQGKISDVDARRIREAGLNRLRGPGAWVTYDSDSQNSTAATTGPSDK